MPVPPEAAMRLVVLESPFAATKEYSVQENVAYARRALLDCLRRGESPIASHLLLPAVLDDGRADERWLGIRAGLAWYRVADACVVYSDRGISRGMLVGIGRAKRAGKEVEMRKIDG